MFINVHSPLNAMNYERPCIAGHGTNHDASPLFTILDGRYYLYLEQHQLWNMP